MLSRDKSTDQLIRDGLGQVRTTLADKCVIQRQKIFGPEGNPIVKQVIKEFLQKRFASENMDFLEALNNLINDSSLNLKNELERIYTVYIAKTGASTVNLEGATFKRLDEHFDEKHKKYIFGPAVTEADIAEFIGALSVAVETISQLINKNVTEAYIAEQLKEMFRLEKEKRELKALAMLAMDLMEKYPYLDLEYQVGSIGLPSLAEYVTDKIEQATRIAVISNYEAWQKFISEDKAFIDTQKSYLKKNQLISLDSAYKKYALSLEQVKGLGSEAALLKKAKCEWDCLLNLKGLINVLDNWLALQSKSVPNVDLKVSVSFKNILGLKEGLLKDYASKLRGFVNTYDLSLELKPPQKKLLAIQTSFFPPHDASDEERSTQNKKRFTVSSTKDTSPEDDNFSDEVVVIHTQKQSK